MLFLSLIKFHIYITSKMLGLLQGLPLSGNDLANVIGQKIVVKDPKVIPHIANILSYVSKNKAEGGLQHISNIAKQTQPKINNNTSTQEQLPISIPLSDQQSEVKGYSFGRFSNDVQKLQLAGYGLPLDEVFLMEVYLKVIAQQYNAKQVRFWGKILGIWRDYYVIQGVAQQHNYLENIGKGDEKRGEGGNYYTFWVSTNLAQDEWTELPLITTQHVKVARKIKTRFTGNLQKPIDSYPEFPGEQSHYLKAQLVRMTSSLQLVPKGIYKPNDQNPKITQFQDEPKVPQFGELSTIQTWVHRNQNLLHLGRCTHYIDPATPEDQLEAVTAQLTEKDPEVERLRSITQDKLPEGNQYGLENIWQIRNVGVSQVFQKDEASNVYGAVVLKNLYWPGWVTIGYKGGFVNYYTGFGHKWSQAAWNQYQNPNLGQQAEQPQQFREPNPKDEPKVVAEVPAQQAPQE